MGTGVHRSSVLPVEEEAEAHWQGYGASNAARTWHVLGTSESVVLECYLEAELWL